MILHLSQVSRLISHIMFPTKNSIKCVKYFKLKVLLKCVDEKMCYKWLKQPEAWHIAKHNILHCIVYNHCKEVWKELRKLFFKMFHTCILCLIQLYKLLLYLLLKWINLSFPNCYLFCYCIDKMLLNMD